MVAVVTWDRVAMASGVRDIVRLVLQQGWRKKQAHLASDGRAVKGMRVRAAHAGLRCAR
jgi:hypothetical protein